MSNNSEKVTTGVLIGGGVFLALILFGALALYSSWAAAFVGVKLWAWFVVPVFGLPTLGLAQAYGLSLLCHFWTYQHFVWKAKDERETKEKVSELVGVFIGPWFTLLVGWICKAYFLGA